MAEDTNRMVQQLQRERDRYKRALEIVLNKPKPPPSYRSPEYNDGFRAGCAAVARMVEHELKES